MQEVPPQDRSQRPPEASPATPPQPSSPLDEQASESGDASGDSTSAPAGPEGASTPPPPFRPSTRQTTPDADWVANGPPYLPRAVLGSHDGPLFSHNVYGATIPAPAQRRRSVGRTAGRLVREVAETIVLALLIFLLVRAVVQNFQVEGRSMQPTFETGWYLLVNKMLYAEINLHTVNKFLPFIDPGDDPTRYVFRGPRRGDVIVFKAPDQLGGRQERDFIKRIIAVPGETVEVRDCTVFINNQPLDEPYIAEKPLYTYGPETVPPAHLFVLGDNRNNSSDSHSWGMLPKENVVGQAWLSYWPFSAFGLVDNTSVTPTSGLDQDAAAERAPGKPVPACS